MKEVALEAMPIHEPLTAFEEYMSVEDCIEHPMTFSLFVTFKVPPNGELLAKAFDRVVRRHRLLCVRLNHAGRPSWCCTDVAPPKLTLSATCESRDGERGIDVRRQAGLRATLWSLGDESRLTLRFHHSCCDGIAAVEFLQQLLRCYAQHLGGRADGSSMLGSGTWPLRNFRRAGPTLARRVVHLGKDLERIFTFFGRRPLSLARTGHGDALEAQDAAEPLLMANILPQPRELLKRRHGLGVTINDVILRDVFQSVAEFTQQGVGADGRDWIRVAVATNMRERGRSASQCVNDVSMVFLDRRRRGIHDSKRLLQSVSSEMAQIKRDRMGRAMLRALRWLQAVPRGLSLAHWVSVPATVVVSNLGEVFLEPGTNGSAAQSTPSPTLVKHLSFSVPVRRGVPIAIGVLTYGGRLTVSMQYDPAVCAQRSAGRLFALLLARIERSLGGERDCSGDADRRSGDLAWSEGSAAGQGDRARRAAPLAVLSSH